MQNTTARILWVAFDFPPRMSSGVFRPIKIYKYLDKDAFAIDFVTHGAASRFREAVEDPTLLTDVTPSPQVRRVPTPIPHDLLAVLGRVRRRARRSATRSPAPSSPSARHRENGEPDPAGPGFASRLYRRFAMATYFPDHLFVWGWLAAFTCLWLHLRHRYDVVYTTSYPESAHLAGVLLRMCGVRWVADYRYGGPMWIKHLVGYRKSAWRERLDHAFQRYVMTRADHVIAQSEPLRADFCRVFAVERDKVSVIPNGYDEHDFAVRAGAAFAKHDNEIHVLHVGAMEGVTHGERQQIGDSLNRLATDLRTHGRHLILHAVGHDVFGAIGSAGRLRFEYRYHGIVAHHELLPYLLTADGFLLSTITTTTGHGAVNGFIPGKLWEYLRAGGPILLAGPKDAVWSVIEEAGVGLNLDLHGDVRVSIEALIARTRMKSSLHPTVGTHSWESRARSFHRVFQRVITEPRHAVRVGEGHA